MPADAACREYLEASEWTPTKQQRFERFLRAYTKIAARIQRLHRTPPWAYVDLTAGSGRLTYGDTILEGSPLIALRTFLAEPLFAARCIFIERHPGRAEALRQVLDAYAGRQGTDRVTWMVLTQDHSDLLEVRTASARAVIEQIRAPRQYGLLYWDGLGQDICPMSALNAWMRRYGLDDLLVMASGCAAKRANGAGLGRDRLDTILQQTIRRHRWIARPETAWQWTFALMTNWGELGPKLSNGDLRFRAFDSPDGAAYLDLVGTTVGERSRRQNPTLFDEYV